MPDWSCCMNADTTKVMALFIAEWCGVQRV
jgi:hypothetical protein